MADAIYDGVGLRHSKDIDVLVDPAQLDKAEAVLAANGYKRLIPELTVTDKEYAQYCLTQKDFTYRCPHTLQEIELHWRLFYDFDGLPLSFDELYEQRVQAKVHGQALPAFCLEHHALYLAVHGCQSFWGRDKWTFDWYLLMQRETFDWSSLLATANKMNLGRNIAIAALVAVNRFGCSVPLGLQVVNRSRWAQILSAAMCRYPARNKYPPFWYLHLLKLVSTPSAAVFWAYIKRYFSVLRHKVF